MAKWLSRLLTSRNYATDTVHDAEDAHNALDAFRYDMVLLDIGLPGTNGLALLKARRAKGDTTPVIILTARHALDHRIEGLNSGADDYLAKPFEVDELEARL